MLTQIQPELMSFRLTLSLVVCAAVLGTDVHGGLHTQRRRVAAGGPQPHRQHDRAQQVSTMCPCVWTSSRVLLMFLYCVTVRLLNVGAWQGDRDVKGRQGCARRWKGPDCAPGRVTSDDVCEHPLDCENALLFSDAATTAPSRTGSCPSSPQCWRSSKPALRTGRPPRCVAHTLVASSGLLWIFSWSCEQSASRDADPGDRCSR